MSVTLVVEDCAKDLELFKKAVGQQFGEIICCIDGPSALSIFRTNRDRIDVVIVDLGLNGMPGAEVIRRIRSESDEIPIHVLTGSVDPEKRNEAILAGATGFFEKPYKLEDYRMLVNQLLSNKAAFDRGKSMNNWRVKTLGCVALIAGIVVTADFGKMATKIANCIVSSCTGVALILAREQKEHEKENGKITGQ